MREIRWSCAVAACAWVFVWSNDALGQASAIAEKLFVQAVDYMKAGDFPSACPLLERSYQLDPKDGTLFTLADCRDHEGKLTIASGHYRAYLRIYDKMTGTTKLKHKERATNAEARIAELEALLPKVKFVWETAPPPESKILVDGVEFRADTLDVLLPLDPGTHQIVIQIPGEPNRTRTVTLAQGGSSIIDLTPAKPKEPDPNAVGPNKGPDNKGPVAKPNKMDPTRVAGFVSLGLGVAGLATGAATGVLALQQKETVDVRCNVNYVCDVVGFAAVDRFRTFGNVSTISFIVGGVLAGAGVTLVLLSRRTAAEPGTNLQVRTSVLPGNANISLEGAF